jgi:HK97 family phage portal protein
MLKQLSNLFSRGADTGIDLSKATAEERIMLSRIAGEKERAYIEKRLGVPIHKFADFDSYLSTGCKQVWATYRSCKLISATIISATFKVVEKGADSTDVELPSMDTGVPDTVRFGMGGFLVRPNPYDSWEEMMEMTTFHLELTGNAYWLKDEPDLLGRPTHIYPLLPQYIKIVPGKKDKVAKYIYSVNGVEIHYKPTQIIHFKHTHPTSLHMGMGSIEPSESLYNQFINKATLEEKFVENGAQVSGVMVREDGDIFEPSEWDKLKKKFNLEYTGKKNAGKVAFLNGKWAYHKLGLSMAEMQALEKEKWTVEQIFLNHGVPLSVAGIQGAANYATARQDEINFRKYKIVPLLDTIVGKLNGDGWIQATGRDFVLAYELSGLIDVQQVVEDYAPLLDRGALTRNELRELCGLPTMDNPLMDEFTVSSNVVPLDLMGISNPSNDLLEDVTVGNGRNQRKPPPSDGDGNLPDGADKGHTSPTRKRKRQNPLTLP